MTIEIIKAAIEAKKKEIKEKQAKIDSFEYSATDSEYDDFLDEIDGEVEVGGLTFMASDIIKSCDPTAYRVGKSDYESDKDLDDVEEYKDLKSELEELESELEDLESELEEAENYQSIPEDFK